MSDPTEGARRILQSEINSVEGSRAELEKRHGKVWDTDELRLEFEVLGFMAPFVAVTRRDNGEEGLMMFQHSPRFYFAYEKVK